MKHIIVTGATGAIGSAICQALACEGYALILACRDLAKAQQLTHELPKNCKASFLRLDLADDAAVHAAVAELPRLIAPSDEIAAVVNNAGIMAPRFSLSPQGHEMDMTVNYLNTRLWTRLLLQSDMLTAGSAIVFTTSLTRFMKRGTEIPAEPDKSSFSQLGSYGASKRALTLYASALSRRLAPSKIFVNCADPGIVNSSMITMHRWFDPIADAVFRPFIRSPKKGAMPALRALKAGLDGRNGRIYCLHRSHTLPPAPELDI